MLASVRSWHCYGAGVVVRDGGRIDDAGRSAGMGVRLGVDLVRRTIRAAVGDLG